MDFEVASNSNHSIFLTFNVYMYLFNPAMFLASQTPNRSSPGWKWRMVENTTFHEKKGTNISVARKALHCDRNCQV